VISQVCDASHRRATLQGPRTGALFGRINLVSPYSFSPHIITKVDGFVPETQHVNLGIVGQSTCVRQSYLIRAHLPQPSTSTLNPQPQNLNHQPQTPTLYSKNHHRVLPQLLAGGVGHPRTSSGSIPRSQTERGTPWNDHSFGNGTG